MQLWPAFAMIILCIASAASAQMPYSPDEGLRGELQLIGIDPSQVDWMAMDTLCGSLRNDAEAHRYCIKQKVVDKKEFQRDAAACQHNAAMATPMIPRPPLGFKVPQGNTPQQQYEITRRQHMAINLAKRRAEDPTIGDYSYETCMGKKRWRNSSRWQDGREEEKNPLQGAPTSG